MKNFPLEAFVMPAGAERKRAESRYTQMSPDETKDHIGDELYEELQRMFQERGLIEPIGKGTERLVFAIHALKKQKKSEENPENIRETRERNVVAKVHSREFQRQMNEYLNGDMTREQAIAELEALRVENMDRDKDLREFFGTGAVLPYRSVVTEVPMSADLFLAFYPDTMEKYQEKRSIAKAKKEGRAFPQTFPMLVEIQPRHDEGGQASEREVQLVAEYAEMNSPGLRSLGSFKDAKTPEEQKRMYEEWTKKYPEQGDEWKKMYEKASKLLTEKPQDVFSLPYDEEIVLEAYPELGSLALGASVSPVLKEKLGAFAKQAMAYTEKNGMVLDLAGHRNIFLEKTKTGVKVRMMDPIYHDELALPQFTNTIGKLKKYSEKDLESMPTISPEDAFNAVNVLHEVHMINAYAIIAGIPERLEIAGLSNVQPRVWLEQFERVFLKDMREAKKKKKKSQARAEVETVAKRAG